MLRWFQALMPREDRFFDLYNRHAQTLAEGAGALCELLQGGANISRAAHKVIAFEQQADAIARDVLLLVRRTFITPFDRSDIKDLINALDDTIDQMQKTAKAVLLFEVERLEPEMAEMGERILQSAGFAHEQGIALRIGAGIFQTRRIGAHLERFDGGSRSRERHATRDRSGRSGIDPLGWDVVGRRRRSRL